MLNGTLTLWDIRDTEAFCAHILEQRHLTDPDHEDLLAYLIEETWILSTRYIPGQRSFSAYATEILRARIIDYKRRTEADHRYRSGRQQPELIPLDDRLADTLTASPLDDPAHRDPDLPRLLRNRDRTQDRPYPTLGHRPTRRAA